MIRILPLYASEAQLIAGLRQAEARAQKVVFERYAGRMLAVCARYIGDRYTAEEVLMDGFMRVFERIEQYKNEGSFEGWMRRIMVNESLMYLRRHKHWLAEMALDEAPEVQDEADYHLTLDSEELLRLIEALPEGYRTIFNLYAIEGYSHTEIARMLNISESTSKSQLHRARAVLQRQLSEMSRKKNSKLYESAPIG